MTADFFTDRVLGTGGFQLAASDLPPRIDDCSNSFVPSLRPCRQPITLSCQELRNQTHQTADGKSV
jgi:hypothetical protein